MQTLTANAIVRLLSLLSESVNRHTTANDEYLDYIYGEPALAKCIGTIFLIHGFQDISFGWRNQIPILIEEGFRTVAIDCIGYGGTVRGLPHYTQLSVGAGGVGVVTVFHRFGLSTAYQGQFQLTDLCVTGGPLSTT